MKSAQFKDLVLACGEDVIGIPTNISLLINIFTVAEHILSSAKAFYQKQKLVTSNKQEIFDNTVQWIRRKHPATSNQAAEVVAAFYVQNCELFE